MKEDVGTEYYDLMKFIAHVLYNAEFQFNDEKVSSSTLCKLQCWTPSRNIFWRLV